MKQPLVSIALCTYNGEKYLREQIDSILGQTYSNIEIIAVDDGSKDGTLNLLQSYASQNSNIVIYKNDVNLGYIKNFEKAISLCKGDYIALADQDDIWDLNKISILVDEIEDNLLIYHNSEFIDESGQSLNRKMTDVRNFYSGTDSRVFLFENCVSGHAMLFKKELVGLSGSFNTNIFHDWWLAYIATCHAGVKSIDRCLVKYRQHIDTSTNILRLDRGNKLKKNSLQQYIKERDRLALFVEKGEGSFKNFKLKLLRLFNKRIESYFSFYLAYFIWKNRKALLYIQKKSEKSKFNFSLKYAWGYKLKKLFN